MPLIRGHHSFDDHFTQIPNAWLRDSRISLGAKGLLAQLLSHAPGWRISQESLGHSNGVGRDAIRTLINELLDAGYLMRSEDRERTEKGYLGGYTYTTQDPTAQPTQDNPTQDNPLHKNNITKKNNLKNNERILSDSKNEFDNFWELYPKKVDKGAAIRAFRKALKTFEATEVIAGAKRYAEDPNLPEKRYVKNPATWLNAEAWNNPPLPERKKTDSKALEEWAND
jgi:biotin operon repressor